MFVVDIDGDGDMDVLGSYSVKIAWFENTDGQGTLSTANILSDGKIGKSVHANNNNKRHRKHSIHKILL